MLTWLRRVLLGGLALLVLLLVAGVVYEQWGRREAAREFPPPGELVEFDGALSHLDCAGEGSPTVVLEAGLGVAGSRSWSAVQPELADDTPSTSGPDESARSRARTTTSTGKIRKP